MPSMPPEKPLVFATGPDSMHSDAVGGSQTKAKGIGVMMTNFVVNATH